MVRIGLILASVTCISSVVYTKYEGPYCLQNMKVPIVYKIWRSLLFTEVWRSLLFTEVWSLTWGNIWTWRNSKVRRSLYSWREKSLQLILAKNCRLCTALSLKNHPIFTAFFKNHRMSTAIFPFWLTCGTALFSKNTPFKYRLWSPEISPITWFWNSNNHLILIEVPLVDELDILCSDTF